MPGIVYLLTGANRSIGLSLVRELVKNHPDATNNATELRSIAEKAPERVHVVKLVSGDVEGTRAVASEIKSKVGYLDVVIANAGISSYYGPVVDTPLEAAREHFEVNFIGSLVLFQETYELLKASTNAPKFIPLSSAAASLELYLPMPPGFLAYGTSKAAVNYLARKAHFENEWLISFPLSPGIVTTDMAKDNRERDLTGALRAAQDAMAISAEDAAHLLVDIITNATREKHGGQFVNIDGKTIPW
ncbi:NAD(P)-binding protein [Flagelloscypha sp. PMI_526]|nr:NAD(P)-binding protein [Flagelloscypha sp. PMI_526]